MITIEVEGLIEVQLRFQQALENLPRGIQGALEDMAEGTILRAKALASERLKNPGSYLDSFYISAAPLEVMFGNAHKAAKFIEYGTGVHVIEPRERKALRFDVDGTTVFAKRVLHPGTEALWILSDAFTEELSGLMEKIKEATKI